VGIRVGMVLEITTVVNIIKTFHIKGCPSFLSWVELGIGPYPLLILAWSVSDVSLEELNSILGLTVV
jgi:hypothetical protein